MAAVLAVQFRNLGLPAATWCGGLVGAGLTADCSKRLEDASKVKKDWVEAGGWLCYSGRRPELTPSKPRDLNI